MKEMIVSEKKILSLLGLLMKGAKLVSGEDTVLGELKKNKLYLIILADDASYNTKKRFKDKASYRSIPVVEISTKDQLGKSVGKNYRSVVGILDKKAAGKILEYSTL